MIGQFLLLTALTMAACARDDAGTSRRPPDVHDRSAPDEGHEPGQVGRIASEKGRGHAGFRLDNRLLLAYTCRYDRTGTCIWAPAHLKSTAISEDTSCVESY